MIDLVKKIFFICLLTVTLFSCVEDELEGDDAIVITEDPIDDIDENDQPSDLPEEVVADDIFTIILKHFTNTIDADNLSNYQNQNVPNYIREDNTRNNPIKDEIATLGRVLFYDKSLSSNNSVSCASCHQQAFAFGDQDKLSAGVNGFTGRHSMRLINARFAEESRFFWDERAANLETQTTMPIQDHIEMGFRGTNGDDDMNMLIDKLEGIEYMPALFELAYGDESISEERMQTALAQFIRSIQSFDSKYDQGRSQQTRDDQNFSNYTAEENLGKALFMGRAGCDNCHRPPEFDIDRDSRNNGVTGVAGSSTESDFSITRSPTLRDIFNSSQQLNGPLMHDASLTTMRAVVAHYNDIDVDPENRNLDRRLMGGGRNGGGNGQNLNLSNNDIDAIVAFIATLSGSDVYTNEKWSDPFE